MPDVRCDAFEKHKLVWLGDETVDEFESSPICLFEITHTVALKEDVCEVELVYSTVIKDGVREIIRLNAPYSLMYVREKYDRYGEIEILTSAVQETEMDGYLRCLQLVDIFVYAKIIKKRKVLN